MEQKRKRAGFIRSLFNAFKGLFSIFKTQRNVRIIFACGFLALLLGIQLKVSLVEMLIIVLTAGLVCVAEVFNTMVEETINLITVQFDPRIKSIKDISAGAVLLASIISLVVGYFIFIRRILELIG